MENKKISCCGIFKYIAIFTLLIGIWGACCGFASPMLEDGDAFRFDRPVNGYEKISDKNVPALPREFVQATMNRTIVFYTTPNPAEQARILRDYYYDGPRLNKLPVFEDPLMRVYGRQSFRVQFRSLIKFFSDIRLKVLPLDTKPPKTPAKLFQIENGKQFNQPAILGGNYELIAPGTPIMGYSSTVDLVFRTHQQYLPRPIKLVLPEPTVVDLPVVQTKLVIDVETGRILAHRDIWEHQSESSWIHDKFGKRIVGSSTSTIFKFLGW